MTIISTPFPNVAQKPFQTPGLWMQSHKWSASGFMVRGGLEYKFAPARKTKPIPRVILYASLCSSHKSFRRLSPFTAHDIMWSAGNHIQVCRKFSPQKNYILTICPRVRISHLPALGFDKACNCYFSTSALLVEFNMLVMLYFDSLNIAIWAYSLPIR